MNITSVQYLKNDNNENDTVLATIDGVEMSVPIDQGNRHWIAVQKWVADGNTIDSAD